MGYVVGVDVGTSAVKAAVVDPGVGVVARGDAPYPTRTPSAGMAEQDPTDWWAATRTAVRRATAGLEPSDVTAIAVSGQGAALVLLDTHGAPVRPAMIHLDQRAGAEAAQLRASAVGTAITGASGNRPGAWNSAAKLSWVRTHEPHTFARTTVVTSAAGYVLAGLVGRPAQNVSDAGISDLFDLGARTWSTDVLATLDLDVGLFPPVHGCTEEVGQLAREVADELGLGAGVRVVAGGEDTSAAALAVGVLEPGDCYLSLGTAGVAGVAVGTDATPQPRLLTFPHVRSGLNLLSGSMSSAGAAVSWLAGVTGSDVTALLAAAATVPAGAGDVVFLPYLAGELHPIDDPAARAVFSGLSLATGPAELARAVVEGSAGAVAHNLAVAAEAGTAPTRLNATGRPSLSPVWMQAVADATGVPVDVHDDDGAVLGDALLAAAGTDGSGTDHALPGLVAAHRRVRATYEPRPDGEAAAARRRQMASALYAADRSVR